MSSSMLATPFFNSFLHKNEYDVVKTLSHITKYCASKHVFMSFGKV